MSEPLEEERVTALAQEIMRLVRANFLRGPSGRNRVYEALNALASSAAWVAYGTGDPAATEFFMDAFANQITELARRGMKDERNN